ncbi:MULTISPECIES: aspartate aminotransferase family protein [Stutzerimonas stutzeri subgroup]|uniref:Acetylornithine aminotransferase n=1 Tax=Stutzerimonas stutzeri CCUG 29243 TaxID=1196835 RepID=I4CYU7_STUST|nr:MULTISPECIES: aspartate aminotransferase family protein [Stutzerimonas stutzeri subgroup]AFM35254.1 acetylornithine and succinylornithine aminotransferase [Stutzerimonas stutzeri CCUG 29243]MCQ2038277.1 aspartate aminotransferase family protein [Stutzerimonas kunmingensis]
MDDQNSHLMHAYARQPVYFTRGQGARLWDTHGREYLDAIAGVAVTNLGHSHPEIAAAIADQAGRLMHTSNMFGIEWQDSLGSRLCAISEMRRAFFCNSGAEANETALKLARLHASRRGVAHPLVVVMENSFHGRTLATLAATGNPGVQRGFEPLMPGFMRVPYADIDAVRTLASQFSNIVAVLVEPVQGESGVRIAPIEYMQVLRDLCTANDWLFMVDEVQTGFGRTGAWFGYQHAGVLPDVITLAKGLGNGYPIGACLARGTAADLFSPGHHGSTFGGNPMACRIGCTVVDVMERERIPQRARVMGQRLEGALRQGLAGCEGVVAIRALGLMVGIELDRPCTELLTCALKDEALLISVSRERTIRLLPALICSEAEIDEIAARLSRLVWQWSRRCVSQCVRDAV